MASTKLTALTAATTGASTDIIYIVVDPSGTPLSRKITKANFLKEYLPLAGGTLTGDVVQASDKAFYFGATDADGSWRMNRSGNNLVIERRESGSWVEKAQIVP